MKENVAETVIGAAVLGIAAVFLFYMTSFASVSSGSGRYDLIARFQSAEGIVAGSDVRLAGVKIGSVTGMSLDPKTYLAQTNLSIDAAVLVPDDSEVGVATEGLLGGAFVEISPGASEFMLNAGDEIVNTQSAVSLVNLLLRFATQSSQ